MDKLYSKNRRFKRSLFYNTPHWRKRSGYQRAKMTLCEHCKKEGFLKAAKVADHVDPTWRSGGEFLRGKLQSLCVFHHNLKTHFEDVPLMRREQKTKMEFWDG